jgi:arylsulfatase
MAYTFNNAERGSKRKSQFYRMGDHRGIYKDGWNALAMHRPGTAADSDNWSLFNLKEDVTQSTNLATEQPDTLKRLQSFWEEEAQRLGAEKMIEPLLKALGGKQPRAPALPTYTFYPNTPNVPEKSTPKVMGRDFSVSVPVNNVVADTEGVLVAHGNSHSGYVLYVQNSRLIVEYNYLGTVASKGKHYKLVSDRPVPLGASNLGFKLEKTWWWFDDAELTLLIDGQEAGQLTLKSMLKKRISHEGLDVGRDRYNSVGIGYSGPYPFKANIEAVLYKVEE